VECIARWETDYSKFFHRTGFALLSVGEKGHPYLEQCKKVLADQGVKYAELSTERDLKERYPAITGNLSGMTGYLNPVSGWADAAGATRFAADRCSDAGVSFITGDRGTVTGFVRSGRGVTGVKVRSGGIIPAGKVILATGAWTSRLVDMENSAHSTAQPVGFIQLTPEEAKSIADIPVCINLTTGFFVFPPTPGDHVLKIARHGFGYESDVTVQRSQDNGRQSVVSAPNIRTAGTVKPGFFIPEDAEVELRRGLALFLPQFKDHPWSNQRLCWYTDTATGDFIIDYHPNLEGVFVATGGSGQ
jgi:sarcosine oxidase/L-pipecolate oxidase